MKLSDYLAKRGDALVDEEALDKLLKPVKKHEPFVPKLGEYYWSVMNNGTIQIDRNANEVVDKLKIMWRKAFRTKEEAAFDRERDNITAELQRMAEDAGGVEWGDNATKFSIEYNYHFGTIGLGAYTKVRTQGAVDFPSQESAQAAIDAVGEDRIRKYLFGVEPKEGV